MIHIPYHARDRPLAFFIPNQIKSFYLIIFERNFLQ